MKKLLTALIAFVMCFSVVTNFRYTYKLLFNLFHSFQKLLLQPKSTLQMLSMQLIIFSFLFPHLLFILSVIMVYATDIQFTSLYC